MRVCRSVRLLVAALVLVRPGTSAFGADSGLENRAPERVCLPMERRQPQKQELINDIISWMGVRTATQIIGLRCAFSSVPPQDFESLKLFHDTLATYVQGGVIPLEKVELAKERATIAASYPRRSVNDPVWLAQRDAEARCRAEHGWEKAFEREHGAPSPQAYPPDTPLWLRGFRKPDLSPATR
jgi:hypothetical protein